MLTGSTKRGSLLLVFLLISSGILVADTIDEIYRQLTAKYDTIENYAADFHQNNYWKVQDRTMKSNGIVYISGEKMAIVFTTPSGQKMIVDRELYLIDEVERTIIITGIEHTGGMFKPNDIIRLYWMKSERELINVDDQTYKIILVPEDDPYTARAEMLIRKGDYLITGVSYEDHQQNRVEFRFSNEVVNRPVDQQVYTVPKDEDFSIIDSRDNKPRE